MKKILLLIPVLILTMCSYVFSNHSFPLRPPSLIVPYKPDNLKFFDIHSFKLGDSLLRHLTKEEINQNTIKIFDTKRNHYTVHVPNPTEESDKVLLYLKTGDPNFIIRSIDSTSIMDAWDYDYTLINPNQPELNYNYCKNKMIIVSNELDLYFHNYLINYYDIIFHELDKSLGSIIIQTTYTSKKKFNLKKYITRNKNIDVDFIKLDCTFWRQNIKKKYTLKNSFDFSLMSKEIIDWIDSNYK